MTKVKIERNIDINPKKLAELLGLKGEVSYANYDYRSRHVSITTTEYKEE